MTSEPGQVVISPDRFDAVIFDLDGVITDTARVHATAWEHLFDEYLAAEAPPDASGRPFSNDDYRRHVEQP
ncbi:MAG: HAD hydrolase-like protein [Acidobacteria bacterium]|nr:HAD hydrolase-like protein [Acidobacteriota bacterium]